MEGGIWLFQMPGLSSLQDRTSAPEQDTQAFSQCLSTCGPKAVESSFFPREGTSPSPLSHLRMAYFGFGLSLLRGDNMHFKAQLSDPYVLKRPTSPHIAGARQPGHQAPCN